MHANQLPIAGMHIRPYRPSDFDAVMEIKRRKHTEWFPERGRIELFQPDDPTVVSVIVVADEDDKPVAALGARWVAELGSTIDDSRLTIHQMRDLLLPAWAMLAGRLFRRGLKTAYARVSSPTPVWGKTLQKRAGFEKSPDEHFYFDLEAAARRLKKAE